MESPIKLNPNLPFISVGKHIYQFEPGEYILDNGSCVQYCVANEDKLKVSRRSTFSRYSRVVNITLPKKEIKRLEKVYDKIHLPDTSFGGKRWRLKLKRP